MDYRVTNPFGGIDYLNGGKHLGTDIGNFRPNARFPGDPIVAIPGVVRWRGRRHLDSALALEADCGPLGRFVFWHLSKTLPHPVVLGQSTVGSWYVPPIGATLGVTGNSGARLPNGDAMPSHTHVELYPGTSDKPADAEPYLLGKVLTDEEHDMSAVGTGSIAPGVNLRSGPGTQFERTFTTVDIPATQVALIAYKADGGVYEADGLKRTDWWQVRRSTDHWCAAAFVGNRTSPLFPGDCTALENRIAAARTALTGAEQAHAAEGSALDAARKALG